jgi:hypothetical protein
MEPAAAIEASGSVVHPSNAQLWHQMSIEELAAAERSQRAFMFSEGP